MTFNVSSRTSNSATRDVVPSLDPWLSLRTKLEALALALKV